MLRVAQYRSWDELQELRPQWNDLLSRSASDTVFLTWQWCAAWWRNYGKSHDLLVLAAWEDKNLVAVAPLYAENVRRYGMNLRRLRLIGDGSHDSDYLDFFADRGREAETMAAFVDFLGSIRDSWDWLEVNGPRKESSCAASLLHRARERGWKSSVEQVRCAALKLPDRWDDYLRTLDSRFRTTVRSSLAMIDGTMKSIPAECGSEQNISDWLPLLFDLHTRRWAQENLPGVFRDPAKRSFYNEISRQALDQGWLAFHRLNWGDRTLALQFGLVYRNCFHLLQEGYDPEFSAIRPGVALRAWLMRHWIGAGLSEYDFLAGVAPHKVKWGATETSSIRIVMSANRAGKVLALSVPKAHAEMRETVERVVPEAVLSFRRNFIAKRNRNKGGVLSDIPRPSQRTMGIRQRMRRLACVAYSSSLLGRIGRAVATGYIWNQRGRGWSIPLQRREQCAVHILQYHRVNDDGDQFLGGLAVEAFRAQMEHVARNFPIITLDQIAEGNFCEHQYSVAITFDDGYRDNFLHAFPIL